MQLSFVVSAVAMAVLSGVSVRAESHTIRFKNNCGKGTPQLIQNGKVLSSGEDFVSNGPFSAAIAYLQTGECLLNGENCSTLEMTLVNPTAPGAGSSTDISLIAPHAFNVETTFSYFGGCDGQGATCSSADCSTAFFKPNDNQVQVQCESNDVNLLITFCGGTALASNSSKLSSSVFSHTSAAASTKSAVSHAASTTKVVTSAVANVASTATASSATAATASASASSGPKCRAGGRRRRSTEQIEVAARSADYAHRRHHARNMEAVRRAASH